MASQFPSAMHLASRYTTISGTDQGIVNQAACMGEIVLPIAVSQLFERVGATTFMPGNVVLSLLSAVAFAALWAAGERSARAAAAGSEDATEATPLLLSADLSHTIQECRGAGPTAEAPAVPGCKNRLALALAAAERALGR